ncbi:hypothetical protein E2C01_102446 [Portunus trituberculatus]|uniref:Uncharacterized protein n=1 Tax=Portunus trituberculatus TaxID=210409 RepID=A0A5B7KD71_PORTR|nr:hypothetical protein [Portunus trituberculatus]
MKDQQEVKEEEDYVYPSLRLRRYTQGQSFSSSAVTRRPPGEADEQIKKKKTLITHGASLTTLPETQPAV